MSFPEAPVARDHDADRWPTDAQHSEFSLAERDPEQSVPVGSGTRMVDVNEGFVADLNFECQQFLG
jgi:hypothetical protein